jgi:uncharacterized RDD family membrane protein YckC
MATTDERPPGADYPWHDARPPAEVVAGARAAVLGARAGLVTRALANVVDVVVVALVVGSGYVAVAATRFLLSPATFTFPAPAPAVLLLVGLWVQGTYFALTWAVAGGTYGDRLLGLRVTDDRGRRLGWWRCAARAALCTVFPAGLLWVLLSGANRSVQDLLLRTSVVYG